MKILFIKDFILNLSRSQLFLQSSLIEEHPIQQAFSVDVSFFIVWAAKSSHKKPKWMAGSVM